MAEKKTFYQTILDDSFKYFYYSNTLGKYYLFNIVDKKTIQVLVYEDRENVILINNFKLILTDKEESFIYEVDPLDYQKDIIFYYDRKQKRYYLSDGNYYPYRLKRENYNDTMKKWQGISILPDNICIN